MKFIDQLAAGLVATLVMLAIITLLLNYKIEQNTIRLNALRNEHIEVIID